MAVETFEWCPVPGAEVTYEYATVSAALGDGLEQSAELGLNNERQIWNLTFDGDEVRIKAITDFVRRHKGSLPFLWKPPGEANLLKFKTSGTPTKVLNVGYQMLRVTFRQHFGT